jgi:hypothetical protein
MFPYNPSAEEFQPVRSYIAVEDLALAPDELDDSDSTASGSGNTKNRETVAAESSDRGQDERR